MRYDFDQIIDRRSSDSIKWNMYPEDVLPMWVADMDFVSPEPVVRALRERVEHAIYGYPEGIAPSTKVLQQFRELIVERMKRLYSWSIQPEDLLFQPGVIHGFNMACHTIAGCDGGVLVQTPVYTPILEAARTTGCKGREMELTSNEDGTYSVDLDLMCSLIEQDVRLFILCNPHNPVGKVFDQEELQTLAEICLENGVVICADEIHSDLVYEGYRHIPIASLDPEIANSTITLIAPSKTFNIAGLHCSMAIIQNPELRRQYTEGHKGLAGHAGMMGIVAGQAAYEHGDEWLEQVMNYLIENRDTLHDEIQTNLPGVGMSIPQGTYLAWLDCKESGIEGNAYQFFLEQARVALNDGCSFGNGGEGFVRMNFGCPRSALLEAIERMHIALAGL